MYGRLDGECIGRDRVWESENRAREKNVEGEAAMTFECFDAIKESEKIKEKPWKLRRYANWNILSLNILANFFSLQQHFQL